MTEPKDTAPPTRAGRKLAAAARAWRRDGRMEELARIRTSSPERFERIVSPSQRISLSHYEAGKAAAAAEGIDTGGQT